MFSTVRASFRLLGALFILILGLAPLRAQQIGKYVPIDAGSDADRALKEVNAATDPAAKLAAIDKFAAGPGAQGDMAIVADDLYVNYYLSQKNYDKVFEYGDKLFALDPDNFSNAVNLVRAAAEKNDPEKLASYGEKAGAILQRFTAAPPPATTDAAKWEDNKKSTLQANHDSISYVEQLVYNGAYQTPDPSKRAAYLTRFAQSFPDSPYAVPAMGVAATAYQQAQNTPKMLEVANSLLAKDPDNLGMLLLLSDYYGEKGEQLAKAEEYAKKAASLADTAKKPEGMTDERWKQESSLQKGLALSTLGQINLQKKENAQAVQNLQAAAPLLKSNDASYGRNQYRLGFAYLNLKKTPEARQAFSEAAAAKGPYQQLAQDKLKTLPATPARRKRPS
jgi:tetratricopeptide (TPR) repeat protein